MRYYILFILLFVAVAAHAQAIYFRHYQVEDGLANNTVFSVFQDARGFMWFGTKEGLNRFDGTTFKAFDMKLDDRQNLKEFVYSIGEGIRQTLWAGTRKGLYEFDPREETFTLLEPSRSEEILDIKSDHHGKIWFTADLRLYCYNEHQRSTREYKLPSRTASICIAKDQSLWIGSIDGYIFKYDTAKDTFHCVNTNDANRKREVNRIYTTPDGKILIGTIRSLYSFDPASGNYRPLLGLPVQDKPVYVHDILPFSDNTYWIASESGIHSIDLQTGVTTNLRQEDNNPYAVSDNAAYALFRDAEGGIWCGTYFGGINYYHSRHSYFSKYFHTSSHNSLSGNAVREICADGKGNLWVGTEDAGLNKLHIATGEITRFTSREVVSSTNIHGLLVDGNELWVGTFQQGLDVLDLCTGKRIRHYNADPLNNGLHSNFIISTLRTHAGQMLFGTSGGIHIYDRATGRFNLAKGFPQHIYVFCLFEDQEDVLWAGTIGNGLYSYNPKTGQEGHYTYNPGNKSSISSNSVCGISADSEGDLWISTEGGGVCKLGKDRRHFTRYNTDSGLPSNMVYKVMEDQLRRLWISTSRGLVMHNPAHDTWKVYSKAHGLLTDQFNYNSGYRDTAGTLYFGSLKGLISFSPALIGPEKGNPPIYITSFQVNNQDAALQRSITFTDTIRLKYDQSSFAIGFAALTYIAADMTPYVYRMDGLDNEWTDLPSNRKVYFTDLSPGDYTFRIRSGDSERKLCIFISPPWWLSPAAYFAYTLVVMTLVYLLISVYHRRQKEKHRRKLMLFEQEKEKEIYKAKIEFFTNVAHEIRTPLTLIKGPLEMVMDELGGHPNVKKSLKSIERNTERLVALTDQLLDFRKTENHGFSLSFVKVNVPKLVKENFHTFAPAVVQKKLTFDIELPEKSFHAYIDIEAFHKIISNLIGNAVKYAETKIRVLVTSPLEPSGSFRIEVQNDGTLIPWQLREKIFEPFFRIAATEQPGSGIGLPLARALSQLHNGVLELQQSENGMNRFVLMLPIHQKIEFKLSSVQKKST